jgi:hypothetical protein
VHAGFCCFKVSHQLFFGIHFHVILVSKCIFLFFFAQRASQSFCRPFALLSSNPSGLLPLLDLFVLLPAISLSRRIHKTALPLYQPSLSQQLLKSLEQLPGTIPAISFQCLLEIPVRSRIRYRVSGMQSQKYQETKSIPHLKLAHLVAQTVKLLQYQHLEHQHRINGRTLSLPQIPLGITSNRVEFLPKQFPVDQLA